MELSSIVFGAGALNDKLYKQDTAIGDVADVVKFAFDHGLTTIDTSAYYGASEEIVGKALRTLDRPRSSYKLITKGGRWEDNRFDYSRQSIFDSLNRSLQRLGTDYVDLFLIHDVEFQSPEQIAEALGAAFELKKQGKALHIGVSGYPLEALVEAARIGRAQNGAPLDAILSYCNLTLQNNRLLEFESKLRAEGVSTVLNASPLSMSLLRSQPVHNFHPASTELRSRASEIAKGLKSRGIELADVASQYSFEHWRDPTVIGIRSIEEVTAALKNRADGFAKPDTELWTQIETDFGDLHNETWDSGRFKGSKHP